MSPTIEQAQQVLDLLRPRRGRYGVHTPGEVNTKGKAKGESVTVEGDVNATLVLKHLTGEKSIGLFPVDENKMVSYGVIDDDSYKDLNLAALADKVQEHDFPLQVCESKSGGGHLYALFKNPVPPAAARALLEQFARELGLEREKDGKLELPEIFPKDTDADGENFGGWVNLPYFGETRRCIRRDGSAMTREEFLAAAEANRFVYKWQTEEQREDAHQNRKRSLSTPDDHPLRRTNATVPKSELREYLHSAAPGSNTYLWATDEIARFCHWRPEATATQVAEYVELIYDSLTYGNGQDDRLWPWMVRTDKWKLKSFARKLLEQQRSPEREADNELWRQCFGTASSLLTRGIPVDSVQKAIRAVSGNRFDVEDLVARAQDKITATAAAGKVQKDEWRPADPYIPLSERLKDLEDMPWVIKGYIPEATISLQFGSPGSGKTNITLSAAYAVSQGETFAGMETTKRSVMFCDYENNPAYLRSILELLGIEDGPNFQIYERSYLDPPDGPDAVGLHEWVKNCDPKPLIIFDTLRAILKGDENDSGEVRRFFEYCLKLRNLGATIIILHHAGKSGEYRGSSDILAVVDWAWEIESNDTTRLSEFEIKLKKARGLAKTFCLRFDYETKKFCSGLSDNRETKDRVLFDLIAANPDATDDDLEPLAKEHKISRNGLRRFLDYQCRQGLLQRSGTGKKGDPFRYRAIQPHGKAVEGPSQGSLDLGTEPEGLLDTPVGPEPPPKRAYREAA